MAGGWRPEAVIGRTGKTPERRKNIYALRNSFLAVSSRAAVQGSCNAHSGSHVQKLEPTSLRLTSGDGVRQFQFAGNGPRYEKEKGITSESW